GNLANEQNEFTQTALGVQGQEQQTRQAQYDAAYQDLLRRFGLQQQTALGPLQQVLGELLGRNVNQKRTGSSSDQGSILDTIIGTGDALLGAGAVASRFIK